MGAIEAAANLAGSMVNHNNNARQEHAGYVLIPTDKWDEWMDTALVVVYGKRNPVPHPTPNPPDGPDA